MVLLCPLPAVPVTHGICSGWVSFVLGHGYAGSLPGGSWVQRGPPFSGSFCPAAEDGLEYTAKEELFTDAGQ